GGIARAVVPQALTPVLAGLAGGLGVALLGRGVLAAMLFQVNPSNPAVLASAAGSVLLAAAGACLGPAVRTGTLAALRAERRWNTRGRPRASSLDWWRRSDAWT